MHRPRRGTAQADAMRHLGHGLTWALTTGGGAWLGNLLDGRMDSAPVATLLGMVGGGVAGFVHFYRRTVVEPREQERRKGDGE